MHMHGPPTSSSTISHAPDHRVPPTAKPVLNFSIQTGEEFAFEFMRDRAVPKNHLVLPATSPDHNVAPGYIDLMGMIGGFHTGSESAPHLTAPAASDSQRRKEPQTKSFAETENRGTHTSTRSVPRAKSGDSSGRGLSHGYSSSEASYTSRKIKFLCSFGGKILPRPSDGKLRYVGGDTRIFRISKDVSWQDLRTKTLAIYNQPHIIKYQLPGEDLDSLISVSNDEDLRNMMEEFGMLGSGEGSHKIHIFLVSSSDFDEISFNLGSADGDSEYQYLVAVNGIDAGSGKPSSDHALPSTSASELDQFSILKIDADQSNPNRDRSDLAGIRAPSSAPSAITSTPTQPSLSSDHVAYVHSNQGHGVQYAQGSNSLCPVSTDRLYNTENRTPVPLSVPSHYGCTSQYAPHSGTALAATLDQQPNHEGFMVKGGINDAKQGSKNTRQQKYEVDYFQPLEHLSAIMPHHDPPVSNCTLSEALPVSSAQEGSACFVTQSGTVKSLENHMALKAAPAAQASEFNDEHHPSVGSDVGSDMNNHGLKNSPSQAGRIFQSEWIPRDQVQSLNRLSKSDDSLGSQFLILQSQSGVNNESIPEVADPVEGAKKSNLGAPPLNLNEPSIDDGLIQFEKELTEAVPWPSRFGMVLPSEVSDNKKISEDAVVEQSTSAERILDGPNNMSADKAMNSAEKASGKGKLKETTIDGMQTANIEQESDDAMARRVSWEAPKTAISTDVKHEPAALSSTSTSAIPQDESVFPNTENRDIFVDINDRFPPDVLSDFFEKAKAAAQSSTHFNDPVLSLNIPNYEPKSWSFFRNLAQNEFPRKANPGLAEIEEGLYPVAGVSKDTSAVQSLNQKFDLDAEKKVGPSSTFVDPSSMPPAYVSSHIDNQPMMENMRPPVSEFEEPKFEEDRAVIPVMDASLRDIDFEHLQIIKNEDLEELRELGSGTFGTVYHGKWRGSDVAIKRIKKSCFTGRSSEQERLAHEFWREAEILSKLHHPNVVAFYGVVKDGPGGTLATVTEFMVNGSLRHVLQRKDKYLDRRKRLIIAMDAAFGMEYLHSKNIVHFDLKCDNLLVNLKDQTRPICKVGDFGLSKIKRNTLVSGGVRGTLPWMAPELLNGSSNKVSEKVDVFSFGIVMWEILTGEEPYANMHYGAIIGGIVNNTLRPPVPGSCDPEWRRLMEQCWAPDPVQRPAFTEIAGRLRAMSAAAIQVKAAMAAAGK
ncbi:unnamed protein product [Miscanthus lutarioriparius]|uniref:Protein kinase domain-containing protein n=1 Tax=Miscanthus lutarioriparius TaxID=422564 RepID=A0A811RYW9_9POAL|nr:unnamed protein product [Miscanthus lutarioriparius]